MNQQINFNEWKINYGDYEFTDEYATRYNQIKKRESIINKATLALFAVLASLLSFVFLYLAGNIRI